MEENQKVGKNVAKANILAITTIARLCMEGTLIKEECPTNVNVTECLTVYESQLPLNNKQQLQHFHRVPVMECLTDESLFSASSKCSQPTIVETFRYNSVASGFKF